MKCRDRATTGLFVVLFALAFGAFGFTTTKHSPGRPSLKSRKGQQKSTIYSSQDPDNGESSQYSEQDALFVADETTNKEPSLLFKDETTERDDSVFLQQAVSIDSNPEIQAQQGRNIKVAIASVLLAILSYAWQYTHPVSAISLLSEMQAKSTPLVEIGRNGKPSVVDFWAPWCENCKLAAPTLSQIEKEYKDKVNFCMVNGDLGSSWGLIERFGVDAIPHLALVSADGSVETALIGPIPKSVLKADLNVLIENSKESSQDEQQPLPYVMLDVFAQHPEDRKVRFD